MVSLLRVKQLWLLLFCSCSLPLEREREGRQSEWISEKKKKLKKEALDVVAVGVLDKNGLHRPRYLNAEASGRGTISEGSGGVALLEKVCHWGRLLRLLFSWSVDLEVALS